MRPKPRNPFQRLSQENITPSEIQQEEDFTINLDNHLTNVNSSVNVNAKKTKSNPFKKIDSKSGFDNELNNLFSNPLAQMGLDYTSSKMSDLMASNQGFFYNFFFNQNIRKYFEVDQEFITAKLKFILFPFSSKDETTINDARPKEHVVKTDLYIPLMAILSFVLLVAMQLIYTSKFDSPVVLINLVSKFLSLTIFETICVKLITFLVLGYSSPFFETLSICSYKYVGLFIYKLFTLFLPYNVIFVWVLRVYFAISFYRLTV